MAGDLIRWKTMLRIHCMQHWYNLSDGAMEDALYEIASHASVCPVIPG
ncbi:IS5 transposase [Enterobacter asburiae]|uniref:IS5 transposase n=1 Tax=Enterobacter asburiae TaxID=61645 RepID=A0A376FAT9_ENTAS|nr:IS5 transposase [Enterobacter asburiae]